jgi:uncharacterized membrane-anchored protein YhcB (DUF1043 family)
MKSFVMAILMLFSALAFASPTMTDVTAAVKSGNYSQAESLERQLLASEPTAVNHYRLAQILSMENKHKDALNELRQAQALDSTLSFARPNGSVFVAKLQSEQAIVDAQDHPVVQNNTTPMRNVYYPPQPKESHAGTIFAIILVIALIAGLIVFILSKRAARKEQDEAEAAALKDTQDKQKSLLELSKKLDDSELTAKANGYTTVVDSIAAARKIVNTMLAELKDGDTVTSSRVASIKARVLSLVDQAETGPIVTTTSVSDSNASATAHASVTNTFATAPVQETEEYTPPVRHHNQGTYYAPPARAVYTSPQPVIVQNNSGNDLLTGVLIGEALSEPRYERERVVEREYVREPVYQPAYEPPSRDYDSGSDNSSYDSGSDSSSSWDSGSDSSSSFDSGSDD